MCMWCSTPPDQGRACRASSAADVEVAIDPAELEGLDEEGVRALYDERLAQQQSTASREVTQLFHSPPYSRAGLLSGLPQCCDVLCSERERCPQWQLPLYRQVECHGKDFYNFMHIDQLV